jgi:hypothetical protein
MIEERKNTKRQAIEAARERVRASYRVWLSGDMPGSVWNEVESFIMDTAIPQAVEAALAEHDAEIKKLQADNAAQLESIGKLRLALGFTREMICISPAVKDTIWAGPAETLVDYIDAVMDGKR